MEGRTPAMEAQLFGPFSSIFNVMYGAASLLLVAMPEAPSSFLAPSSKARSP